MSITKGVDCTCSLHGPGVRTPETFVVDMSRVTLELMHTSQGWSSNNELLRRQERKKQLRRPGNEANN